MIEAVDLNLMCVYMSPAFITVYCGRSVILSITFDLAFMISSVCCKSYTRHFKSDYIILSLLILSFLHFPKVVEAISPLVTICFDDPIKAFSCLHSLLILFFICTWINAFDRRCTVSSDFMYGAYLKGSYWFFIMLQKVIAGGSFFYENKASKQYKKFFVNYLIILAFLFGVTWHSGVGVGGTLQKFKTTLRKRYPAEVSLGQFGLDWVETMWLCGWGAVNA